MKLHNQSLKTQLLLQLATPLVFFMVVESILSYFGTLHYVNDAYDGWLLDSARSLAQEIKMDHGAVSVELPAAALEIFKWDDQDKTYFKITAANGSLIAGDPALPDSQTPAALDWSQPLYFNSRLNHETVRIVALRINRTATTEHLFVYVAETVNKRHRMMFDILIADLVPQTILLILMGAYLLTGVKRGLKPLHSLIDEIAKRSPRDLLPIPDKHLAQEVHALIHTLNDLFGRLRLAIETQERFIANAAHQLRTPLAGLKLQAERALREHDIERMQPALGHIKNSADRLSHLTSQLLVLARAEPSQHHYDLQPLNLCDFTRQICMDWTPKALERKIEINFDSPNTTVFIQGDTVLLRELIINLLENAITYGFEKGSIWVDIQPLPTPTLSIRDNGPGIPQTEQAKICERFYRIPGSVGDGCGLGLAIVKEIADLHRAELHFSRVSVAGGTQVAICFPPI